MVDFEFSPLPHGDWLLITGAMVNSLNKYKPFRLVGKPIFLPKTGKLTMYHPRHHKGIVQFAERCFAVKKPEVLTLVKGHLNDAINYGGQHPTLSTPRMVKYLHSDNKKPVVVFWNGNTDRELVNRLKLPNITKFLDMTTVENRKNSSYELVLKDMSEGKRVIFTTFIGVVNKPNGGTLNLRECHSLVCQAVHNDITYCHDPVTDVIYTRCIFNYILGKMKPSKLYAYCSNKPVRMRKNCI